MSPRSLFVRLIALIAMLLAASLAAAASPLHPLEAYKMSARSIDPGSIEVVFDIHDDYYLYKANFRFKADHPDVAFGQPALPPGKQKHDEFFGDVEIYRDQVRFTLPIEASEAVTGFQLTVVAQGCWDEGICYPPTDYVADISLTGSSGGGGGLLDKLLGGRTDGGSGGGSDVTEPTTTAAPAATAAATAADDESGSIAALLKNASGPLVLLSFFGFGLLLAFTPCTFPMIPILSGIIVGHGTGISRMRALSLSLAYVLGMAVTYALAGVAAGMSGTLLSAALQNAWVLGTFALVFVVLSLSMFGFYELQLPTALQSRLSETANHQRGGQFGGVIVMGVLSALIVGPCVAAPLAGALLYIAQTRDALFGGLALFVMALGMGVPLLAVGVAARSVLPKVGPWMEGVKKAFGVMLLAVAVWLISPVVPALATMLAWAALLIFSGIFLRAIDPLPHNAHGWQRFWKAVGVILLVCGGAILLGALGGGRDPLQPLAGLRGSAGAVAAEQPPRFQRVRSVAELDAAVAASTRPVMLDFYADWCVSCKEMERYTFSDPAVAGRMAKMLLLQADVTENNADDKALLARFELFGPPGIVFFRPGGEEIEGVRVVGYMPAERFEAVLARTGGG